jgi:hypothetical protein
MTPPRLRPAQPALAGQLKAARLTKRGTNYHSFVKLLEFCSHLTSDCLMTSFSLALHLGLQRLEDARNLQRIDLMSRNPHIIVQEEIRNRLD